MVIRLKDGSVHTCLNSQELVNLIEEKLGSDVSKKVEELVRANDDEIICLNSTIVDLENDNISKDIIIDELQNENRILENKIERLEEKEQRV